MIIKKLRSIGEGYLRDAIYAANDGIVTTFAVVSAVAGAALESNIIIILGFANLLADAFSMATGNYMGTRSEGDQYDHEMQKTKHAFKKDEKKFKQHATKYFSSLGKYSEKEAKTMVDIMSKNKDFFLHTIIYNRIGISASDARDALKNGTVTFFTFVIAGVVPLIPYVIFSGNNADTNFIIVCVFTGITLFLVGSLRTIFSAKNWILGGLEMLVAGGFAAVIAFGLGYALKALVGVGAHLHTPVAGLF